MGLFDTIDTGDDELEKHKEIESIELNQRIIELMVVNSEKEGVMFALEGYDDEELESIGAYLQDVLDTGSPFGYTPDGRVARDTERIVEQIKTEVL